jgi:hypothetical protein
VERREQLREELETSLAARAELGAELEPQLVEGFLDRIEERLGERAQAAAPVRRDKGQELGLAIFSLIVSIPLILIAGVTVGLPAVAMVCAAIVLVNYLFRR